MAAQAAMGRWLLALLALLVAAAGSLVARHAAVLPDGGSGDGEEASATPPAIGRATPGPGPTLRAAAGTTGSNGSAPGGLLDGLLGFFKEYLLLLVVVGSLAFVLLFIVCAALVLRQKHKASAYYPAAFPRHKYVDERDKSGGPRPFSEVPDRAPRAEEPPGQGGLQADILAAAHSLRPPRAAPLNNPPEEEEEEGGSKKLGEEQAAEPPPQDAAAEEAAGAGGTRGEAAAASTQEPPST
ncbi:transmembrane protein 119 isoform X1 [Colius striatus]|uniref:transmembrane protein 119 isoform X1 n=1 Tax=Colius striatus TaxID=57412 RepID=UPI002B1D7CB1|nr:transmembrane protein 119 isoform X1 [Colius striatus]